MFALPGKKYLQESDSSIDVVVIDVTETPIEGIQKFHANSQVPQKKPRKGTLSDEEKKSNRELARQRVIGENVHRKLKIFKILSERYRNRRKRFGLRFNLIAGLYNYELKLASLQLK